MLHKALVLFSSGQYMLRSAPVSDLGIQIGAEYIWDFSAAPLQKELQDNIYDLNTKTMKETFKRLCSKNVIQPI